MQAVILAAGRGRRLAPLTDTIPKPLIEVQGTPIIVRLLELLPESIVDVVIVAEYLEEQLKNKLGVSYKNRCLHFVTQGEKKGTYGALFSARKALKPGSFLVMGSDDLFNQKELEEICSKKLAFGVHKKFLPGKEWLIVEVDKEKSVRGLRRPNDEEFKSEQYMATGVYVLDETFWNYEPVQLPNGEYGLPQTLRPMLLEKNVEMVEMKDWMQINTHEELAYAEEYLGKTHI